MPERFPTRHGTTQQRRMIAQLDAIQPEALRLPCRPPRPHPGHPAGTDPRTRRVQAPPATTRPNASPPVSSSCSGKAVSRTNWGCADAHRDQRARIAYQVIRHRVTLFFVREDFARAVAATDLPHDFTLDDLHWPLPGIVVGFPPRFMQEYMGRDVCYVYAANCDAGDYHVSALAGCPTVVVPKNKVGWQFYAWGDGKLESFVTSYFRGDRVDEAISRYGYTDYTGSRDAEGVEADHIATDGYRL